MAEVNGSKRCGRYKELKVLEAFGKVKGKPRSYCRTCHNAWDDKPDLRTEKRCACCKQTKPVAEFNRLKKRYQPHCRDCQNARDRKKRQEESPNDRIERHRADYWKRRKWTRLKSKYGITQTDFRRMVEEQKNLCAICGRPETEASSPHNDDMNLAVDHCHKTGKVRGLLCRQCNIALGRFRESVEVLRNAIAYLERHSQ